MWLLKSPKDGKPIDVETFIKNDLNNRIVLHNVFLTYEKLSYMMQKDMALIIITKLINSSFPKDSDFPLNVCNPTIIYTLSRNEIELLLSKDYDDRFNQLTNFLNMADKIKYVETEVDKYNSNDDVFISIKDFFWREYAPSILIKDFFDDNMKILKGLFYHDKILDGYNKLLKDVYTDQQKLAKSIFIETDEEDKIGFLRIYQSIKSFVLYEKRDVIKMLEKEENYLLLKDKFPSVILDIDLLLSKDSINNMKPYIIINNDSTFFWNYSIGCFAKYFSYLKSSNDKNTNWELLKEIFPQFKNDNLRNNANKTNQEYLDLLAKVPSFKILDEKKLLPDQCLPDKNEIILRNNNLHKTYNNLHLLK